MSLTVVSGVMFSGKSSYLLKHAAAISPDQRLLLKPAIDTRYSERQIVTHQGHVMNAHVLQSINDIDQYLKPMPYHAHSRITHIFIDEGQFLPGLKDKILELMHDYHIMVAGLDLTFDKKRFGDILDLYPYADQWIHLKARCDSALTETKCSRKAQYTHRLVQSDQTILIGGHESYLPVCAECYDQLNRHT